MLTVSRRLPALCADPTDESCGEKAFERYHRQSVLLNGATMLAVAVALVASHL